tara:strand:+ start:1371 stop:1958 length:588 start_codon:yes stop_codon:yes gene_type:complete
MQSYSLDLDQINKIDQFLIEIKKYNAHTNIVGKSTLLRPWNSHVLDSIQISNFIINKKSKILDMGTGAGLPGIILAINNFSNISLIDSNIKKINFLNFISDKLNIRVKIYHQRIESLLNTKFDFLISRALSKLNKLLTYSYRFLKKDTQLVFLKGLKVDDEIVEAKKTWNFEYDEHKSISDKRGKIIIIRNLKKI